MSLDEFLNRKKTTFPPDKCAYCEQVDEEGEYCEFCNGCPQCCDSELHCLWCDLPTHICGCPKCNCDAARHSHLN
jgi:hypothetical protein